ncbi:MAG: DUF1080 domain-containing protein [bacterium]
MTRLTIITAFAILFVSASALPSLAASMSEMDAQYSKTREENAWKYVEKKNAAIAGYTNVLIALESVLKAKGDLDGILAVRKERENLATLTDGSLPTGETIPAIDDLRAKRKKIVVQVVLEEKRELVATAQQYADRLKIMEKELTVAGKIDDAVSVQARRKKLAEDPDVLEAAAAIKESLAAAATTVSSDAPPADTVTTPKDGSKLLLEGDSLDGWFSNGEGAWSVEGSRIKVTADEGVSKLMFAESVGQDYEFTVRMKLLDGNDAGIVFHDQGWRGYTYSPRMGLVENSSGRPVAAFAPVKGVVANTWYEIKAIAHGKKVRLIFNGSTVWSGDDLRTDSGQIGLCARSKTVALFDSPRLKILKPVESMLKRDTSRIRGFPGDSGGFSRSRSFD